MPHKLVYIEWVDSHMVHGWTRDPPETHLQVCKSVGWLLHDGDKTKVVCPHITVDKDPEMCGLMTIPTCSVVKIEILREE